MPTRTAKRPGRKANPSGKLVKVEIFVSPAIAALMLNDREETSQTLSAIGHAAIVDHYKIRGLYPPLKGE